MMPFQNIQRIQIQLEKSIYKMVKRQEKGARHFSEEYRDGKEAHEKMYNINRGSTNKTTLRYHHTFRINKIKNGKDIKFV